MTNLLTEQRCGSSVLSSEEGLASALSLPTDGRETHLWLLCSLT